MAFFYNSTIPWLYVWLFVGEMQKHLNNLENILDMSNKIQARIKASDDKSKQKMALSKSE